MILGKWKGETVGWFFEERRVLIPTGKVIAEERVVRRLSGLAKILVVVLLGLAVSLSSTEDGSSPSVEVSPTAPAPSPLPSASPS